MTDNEISRMEIHNCLVEIETFLPFGWIIFMLSAISVADISFMEPFS